MMIRRPCVRREEESKIIQKAANRKKIFFGSLIFLLFGAVELFQKDYILSVLFIFKGISLFIAGVIFLPAEEKLHN